MTRSRDVERAPRGAELILRLSLPRGEAGDSIRGDLLEEFRGMPKGAAARRWFRSQVLGFAWRAALYKPVRLARTASRPVPGPGSYPRPERASMLDSLCYDLRLSMRSLAKAPAFSGLAVLLLALGIGVTTAIFSVVDGVLVAPLPYERADRLVRIGLGHLERDGEAFSRQDFADLEAGVRSFESVAGYFFRSGQTVSNLSGEGTPEALQRAAVSSRFFETLGQGAAIGRTVRVEDFDSGNDRVVVLSHDLWRGRFGSDESVVGKTLSLGGEPYEVIGVMPAAFQYPAPDVDIWLPLSRITERMVPSFRELRWIEAFGRLEEGVSIEAAHAEVGGLFNSLAEAHPDTNDGWTRASLTPLRETLLGNVEPALLVLFCATALVLLTACANVANLVLARPTGRGLELAVRLSLGSDRRRLTRQLLGESVLLALVGGFFGLLLAVLGVRILVAMSAGLIPRADAIEPDLRLVGFAIAAAIVSGLLFGLVHALAALRDEPAILLRRSSVSAMGGRRQGLRGLLVTGEVALATMLVLGSGLMLRSFSNLAGADPGFESERIMTLSLKASRDLRPKDTPTAVYHQRLLDAVTAVPGVQSVGGSKAAPLAGEGEPFVFSLGSDEAERQVVRPAGGAHIVTPGYFETLGIRVLEGRAAHARDTASSLLVNRSLARQLWPGRSAVGEVLLDGDEPYTVLGVVEDVRHLGIAEQPRPALYVLGHAFPRSALTLYVRTHGPPLELAEEVRGAIWSVNAHQPVSSPTLLDVAVRDDIAQSRFFATLLALFAALALALATLGIYGVVSYSVGLRRRELGLRMALGAGRGDVLGMVVAQSMKQSLSGLALGLVAAAALGRALTSQLYGVSPTDLSTFVAVAALLASVALAACALPARRGVKVSPVVALKGLAPH